MVQMVTLQQVEQLQLVQGTGIVVNASNVAVNDSLQD